MGRGDDILDVAIVGGGFAGATLAAALLRRGCRVAVCDPHEVHPQDFRAEKLAPEQIDALARLGLLDAVAARASPISEVTIFRGGRYIETRRVREYGFDYRSLVQALREQIVETHWRRQRVADVEAADAAQTLTLHDGSRLKARVVVIATGLALALRKTLGLPRRERRANHSLCVGFDIEAEAGAPRSLTYFGERVDSGIGYLTVFPVGARRRGNLFVYRDPASDWARAFRADPGRGLREALPGLARALPNLAVVGAPVLRPITLYDPPASTRDGVVLVGDAYSTTCPAAGGGLSKALTDIELFLEYLPGWLDAGVSPQASRLDAYVRDPRKRDSELRAAERAEISRATATDAGLYWAARRARNLHGAQALAWMRRRFAGSGAPQRETM